ncbi:MAG: hypothetical protein IKA80_08010 [Spirochaetaceae bacterium]|nr:hypothetical protein [Spirochaetaceae bacterium]
MAAAVGGGWRLHHWWRRGGHPLDEGYSGGGAFVCWGSLPQGLLGMALDRQQEGRHHQAEGTAG